MSEQPKWTPGPWRVGCDGVRGEVPGHVFAYRGADRDFLVCGCRATQDSREDLRPEQDANAQLIAAAPRLYAQLEYLVRQLRQEVPHIRNYEIIQAEEVLAEARGEVQP